LDRSGPAIRRKYIYPFLIAHTKTSSARLAVTSSFLVLRNRGLSPVHEPGFLIGDRTMDNNNPNGLSAHMYRTAIFPQVCSAVPMLCP
jgi:hypothetical protein